MESLCPCAQQKKGNEHAGIFRMALQQNNKRYLEGWLRALGNYGIKELNPVCRASLEELYCMVLNDLT